MQKYFRIEANPKIKHSIATDQTSNVQNLITSQTRPATGINKTHLPKKDETLQLFRVKPQFISKKAVTLNSPVEDSKSKNFFVQNQNVLEQMDQREKGPKFDNKGNVVKYTLVGSVSAYMKGHRSHHQAAPVNHKVSLRQSSEHERESMDSCPSPLKPHQETLNASSFIRNIDKKRRHELTKLYKDRVLSPDEVEEEVEQCITNVRNTTLKSEQVQRTQLALYHKGDKFQISSFDRIVSKHDRQVQAWEREEERITQIVGKEPQESMFRKIQLTRTRKEVRDLIEAITPDYEKYGDRVWQNGLRMPINDTDNQQFLQDSNRKISAVEIIRKTNSQSLKISSQEKGPFQSFSSQQHLNAKLSLYNRKVKDLIPYNPDNLEQLNELELRGNNVLKKEVEAVQRQIRAYSSQETRFIKRTLKAEEDQTLHQHQPEIIDQNWDTKYLLRSGKIAFAKAAQTLTS